MRTSFSIALLLAVAACGPSRSERQVSTFESLHPDATKIANGDFKEAMEILDNMGEWWGYISGNVENPEPLLERLKVAQRRYRLEMARATRNPAQALGLLVLDLDSNDPEVLALTTERGDQLVTQRQHEHELNGTYRKFKEKWVSAEAASWENGRQTKRVESQTNVGSIGNCVSASAPFAAESKPNAGLAYVLHGYDAHLYVRCYTIHGDLPANEVFGIVELSVGAHVVDDVKRTHGADGTLIVDFDIPVSMVVSEDAQAPSYRRIELNWAFARDAKVVVDRGGTLRVRPDIQQRLLAEGSFIYMPK